MGAAMRSRAKGPSSRQQRRPARGRPEQPGRSGKPGRPDKPGRPGKPARPFRPKPDARSKAPEPQRKPVPEAPKVAAPKPAAPLSTAVQTVTVTPDENAMRVARFLEARFPGLSFSHIQRIIRKGQLRVDGKRVEPKDRLEAGQSVRIPPLRLDPDKSRGEGAQDGGRSAETRAFLKSITLYEDDDVMVLNKPMGLAVQGGSGTTRHIDGMLGAVQTKDGQRPRLVHRLDKDTAGCLLVAKSRFAAAALAKTFRSRSARKIYWALVPGVPKPRQGRISTYLAKEERQDDSVMRVAKHGDEGASHAVTYYAVVETAAQRLAWLSLKPVTGRTHQLRVQLAHIGHPIVGDPKYFDIENWQLPRGMQNRLHLLARRIAVPHPRGGIIDVTAPLPPHMQQSWSLIGLDATRYDPIEDAPEG
jgi:23S rRNA pseudouridine955/2504/2580 synthase